MNKCSMCGRHTSHFEMRWYQYDNGERFREAVCLPCAGLHTQLTEGK